MPAPTRPIAPPQALRSNPDTFSANAEASIQYQWSALPTWIESMGDYTEQKAAEASGAALTGDITPVPAFAFNYLRLNADGTSLEYRTPEQTISDAGVNADVIVQIPTDFATMQVALDHYSQLPFQQGATISLNIEAGHQPASGVIVENGDYRHFRITSTDAEVLVAAGFTGDFIKATNAHAPRLGTIVDMNLLGSDGLHIVNNSFGYVENGCGVKQCGGRGLYANNASTIFANSAVVHNTVNRGIWISRNSHIAAEYIDIQYCNSGKAVVTANSIRRNSTANLQFANIEFNFTTGINASRASTINLAGARIADSEDVGVQAERGSTISLEGSGEATVIRSGTYGVYAWMGGVINAGNCTIRTSGTEDLRIDGGYIYTDGATLTGPEVSTHRQVSDLGLTDWIFGTNGHVILGNGICIQWMLVTGANALKSRNWVIPFTEVYQAVASVNSGSTIDARAVHIQALSNTAVSTFSQTINGTASSENVRVIGIGRVSPNRTQFG